LKGRGPDLKRGKEERRRKRCSLSLRIRPSGKGGVVNEREQRGGLFSWKERILLRVYFLPKREYKSAGCEGLGWPGRRDNIGG